MAKDEQTYTLPGVQAEDGTTGSLVFTIKPGGNVHGEFEPYPQTAGPAPVEPDQSLPEEGDDEAPPTATTLPS